MTTHKERLLMALNHEQPDRNPMDLGGRQTTLSILAYENLKNYLSLSHLPTKVMAHSWQTCFIDEAVLEMFDIDTRHVRPASKVNDVIGETLATGESDNIFVDEWGVKRKIAGDYANLIDHPLRTANLDDLEDFPWPDSADNYDFQGLRESTRKLYEQGEYALVGSLGSPGNIFEQAWYLRGLSEFMKDLIKNKDFAHAVMRRILDIRKRNVELYLNEVGEFIDVVQLADDMASQDNLLISPKHYREIVKPYQLELCQHVKSLTNAKIYFHSCGSISPLLDELIEIGVEILNPVQVSAANMDTQDLKKRYGKKLSFWGAIDTFEVLPNGSASDVQAEVHKRICDLGKSGGYVMGPVHNICSDVPPENVVAMYEAGLKYGTLAA
ncbi:MAG: uroporphyrinogen decarboxylase family protein [Arenicellales bacterium]|mgnify:FL=1|jgi:uroporphyrinogen decarboxylase|nr:uroporphyrinogen decarboxylase family protein [Arenicellales bacterium]